MNEILQELITLMNEVLPSVSTDNVTMKSDLRTDLEIDSFHMILLAVSIEDRFGIQIEEDFAPENAGDVCRYIQQKKTCERGNEKGSTA